MMKVKEKRQKNPMLEEAITVRPLLIDMKPQAEDQVRKKDQFVSPLVQARFNLDGDVDGVNRFKFYTPPLTSGGRLVLPLRSNLVSAQLKSNTPIMQEWTEKKPLDSSQISSSSGYQSSTRSSSRIQAISDRLYGNGHRSQSCNRCNSVEKSPPIAMESLPEIDSRHARISKKHRQHRSQSPNKRLISAPINNRMTVVINIERKDDTIRDFAWRGEKLRQEIEQKLKHVRLRHERAMRILRDQQRSIDQPIPVESKNRYIRSSKKRVQMAKISEKPESTNASAISDDANPTYDVDLVDSVVVENDIIKPLVDAVLRESVDAIAQFRTNEALAYRINSESAYDEAEAFIYDDLIPHAVELAG